MPMDGLMLHAVVEECHKSLQGGRVDKVQQPERDEVILTIRAEGENQMLLFSSSANQARLHRTYLRKKNAETPPQFCMLLRKHLLGAKFLSLRQEGLDRIAHMEFETRNELGDPARITLSCEIMGRHSNIILWDEKGKIIDCARHVTQDLSRVREVLPGLMYELPPAQDKKNPLLLSENDFYTLLCGQQAIKLSKLLQTCLSGLSTQAAQEITLRISGREEVYLNKAEEEDFSRYAMNLYGFFQHELSKAQSTLLLSPEGEAMDVTSFRYYSRENSLQKKFASTGEALDAYFSLRDKRERIQQRSMSLQKVLTNAIERCEKKLAIQLDTLEKSKDMDSLRKKGDLLLAAQGQIPKGVASYEVMDYYSEDLSPVTITLDPARSVAQNAQRYYKQYAKLKQAASLVLEQKARNDAELWYLRGQKENVGNCTDFEELTEIREELIREGYIRENLPKKKQQSISHPHHFLSPDGTEIFVGKNNVQNDRLTFAAMGDDWWLHVKDMPGSHVIVRNQHPSQETLLFAAILAATFSSGKGSVKVPVDMTQRKYVKKPSGAKPGFVIYTHQKTVYVSPDESKVKSLLLPSL